MDPAAQNAASNAWYTANIGNVLGNTQPTGQAAAEANQNYQTYGRDLSSAQDVQMQQQLYASAYSQPRNDLQTAAPSANFLALQGAYAQQHYATVGSGQTTYNPQYQNTQLIQSPTNAMQIAMNVAITGGTAGKSVTDIATQEFRSQGMNVDLSGITQRDVITDKNGMPTHAPSTTETVYQNGNAITNTRLGAILYGDYTKDFGNVIATPVKETSQMPLYVPAGSTMTNLGETVTSNVPWGHYVQESLPDSKVLMGKDTGEVAIYLPRFDSEGKPMGYGLSSSGGRNALQSGMFTIGEAETPYTVSREGVGNYIRPSGEGMSRLGAEPYGGNVMALDGRTIEAMNAATPGSVKLSTYANAGNLANFVNPQGPNMSKTEAPATNAPWGISATSPALQYMDENGVIKGSSVAVPAGISTAHSQSAAQSALTGVATPSGLPSGVSFTGNIGKQEISVGSSFELGNLRQTAMGWAPQLFEGIGEAGVWLGSVDITNPAKTAQNLATNIAIDRNANTSFSNAITHAQLHETGFFNRETLIYGNDQTNQLLSTVKGDYGGVSGAVAPIGTNAVAHTHTEPFPFANFFGYSPVASAEDLSGAGAKRASGISQESVITRSGVLTYATPKTGEVMNAPADYRTSTMLGGVFGASNTTQADFMEKTGTKYNVTPTYSPLTPADSLMGAVPAGISTAPSPSFATTPSSLPAGVSFTGGITKVEASPALSGATPAPTESAGLTDRDRAILGGYSGGMIGYALWGEKAPEVIKGGIGSVIDFFPSMLGFTPVADRMRTTDAGQTAYLSGLSQKESNLQSLENYGKSTFGTDEQGRIKIDATNPAATKFQSEYEAARIGYNDYTAEGLAKGYTQQSNGKTIVNPDLTYDYGEFSKWGIGAGESVRNTLGFSKPQLEAYGTQLEQKQGIETIPEKIVYGAGYTLSTHPEKIVTAYGAGIATVGIGEIAGAVAEGTGLTASMVGFGAAHPTAAAVGSALWTYGVPAALVAGTYYGASEGFTASPSRTTINIGKLTPELGAMFLGGATGYGALRAIDAMPDNSFRTLPRTGTEIVPVNEIGASSRGGPGFVGGDIGRSPESLISEGHPMSARDYALTSMLADTSSSEMTLDKFNYLTQGGPRPAPYSGGVSTAPVSFDIGEARLREAYREPSSYDKKIALDEMLRTNIEWANSAITGKPSASNPMPRLQLTTNVGKASDWGFGIPESSVVTQSPHMDIGEAALRFGPASERGIPSGSGAGVYREVTPAGNWKMPFEDSRIPSSTEQITRPRGMGPQLQMQEAPAAESRAAPLPYKQPVDVARLNRLFKTPSEESSLATVGTGSVAATPSYAELRNAGYDWNSASRLSSGSREASPAPDSRTSLTLSYDPLKYPEMAPYTSTPSALESASASERAFALPSTQLQESPAPRVFASPLVATATALSMLTYPDTAISPRSETERVVSPFIDPAVRPVTNDVFAPTITERYTSVNPNPFPDTFPSTTPTSNPTPGFNPQPPTPPPPFIPLPPIFGGGIGGGGGSGGQRKGHRKYMEYFPVGLDISMFGTTKGANPFTEGLGPMKYMARDASFSAGGSRTVHLSPEAKAKRAAHYGLKPVVLKGQKKNIFMK